MPSIVFDHVSKSFQGAPVLRDICCTLTERRIGIIGPNGGGKSTFMRLINGLTDPTSGSVSVDDLSVAKHGKQVRKKVGFIFSDADNQIVMPTVAEDIDFSLRQTKLPKDVRKQKVQEVLNRFGLENQADQSPHTLSGGQKQLLALAAVLVLEPDIIVADEPTTLLDLRNRRMIAHTLQQLDQQLVVVTHDLDLLDGFDRVLCIDDGHIVADGTPADVVADYTARMLQEPLA
ncbi:energy-coupling factor ABC transporter ATP-binding protein [Corynebacterium ulceribovis]|uniref:energy-coupling factor ABC transporter ATP-binding protein n=1 Tax=Corynebacterium ulceribovis TaxID=487732 RepID=UPI00037AF98F|nr:ABC transporter ATP-binding protein [Corynebacterium ulceribovis]